MSVVLVTLLCACALGLALLWAAVDVAGYRPLRRAIARGDVSTEPGTELRPFHLNALGGNPDIAYRYLPLDIPQGMVGIMRGQVSPQAAYYSVVVYDRIMQSVLPERCWGPTFLTERDLDCQAGGSFQILLTHRDLGLPHMLDISAVPDGVLFERHVGAAPQALATLELVTEAQALRLGAPSDGQEPGHGPPARSR